MLVEAQRRSILGSMGVDVFLRRLGEESAAPAPLAVHESKLVVVSPLAAVPARFRAQLPRALGIPEDQVNWCDLAAGVPDDAMAYVVVGTEAARALGVQLSTMQQNTATIVATAEPVELLQGAAAKRVLWQSLKPVARRLRGH